MSSLVELQAELRGMEDDIHVQSEYMGRLKGEYSTNLNKLRDSYWPKTSPLHTAVFSSGVLETAMEVEIDWMEKKVVSMENLKTHFIEVRDMAQAKKKLHEAHQPAFEDAYLQLEAVTTEDLATLRAYEHPPQVVLDTMAMVQILRNENNPTWTDAKLILSATYFFAFFIGKCKQAHKFELPDEHVEALQNYLLSPDNAPDAVASVSGPCGAIAKWLKALHHHALLTRVTTANPKQTVEELKDDLFAKRQKLQTKREDIADAQQRLTDLNSELAEKEK